jgi:pSer/pThr/pTyr-binding forkhead associated (FHA) protein
MSLQLSEIEKRLQTLIEVHLLKYLPGPSYQDRIAQRMAETLRANFSTHNLSDADDSTTQQFVLVVHPSTMAQWQKDPRLMEGLTKIFRLVANEMGLNVSQPLSISLAADPLIAIDSLDLRPSKPEPIAETQNMFESLDETPARAAFLIVGGTKVFSLDHAVTNIGRRLDNHLVVDDPRVSRYHAQIRYVRGRFIIFDLNSTGGTFVNGQRTTQSALYPGDVISLAGLPIVFGQDNPPSAGSASDTKPVPLTPNVDRKTARLDNPPPRDNKES